MAGLVFGVLWGVESRREVKPEDRAEGRGSGSDAGQRGSVGPLVWLAAGAALLLAAFHFRELNPEYVKLVVEKARLVGERAPDDHVNPDSVEKYRPVWHSPLLLLGIGGIAVGAVQIASSLRGRVSGASRGPAEPS